MKIESLIVGDIGTNCYLVYDENKNAVLVDCGDEASRIIEKIDALSLHVSHILLTHAHFDHIGAVDKVRIHTGARVLISQEDNEMMESSELNLSAYHGENLVVKSDATFADGETIACGSMEFTVLKTPGHTRGGVCFYTKGNLFSGDTLFYASIGRCDFPGGDYDTLIGSILEKLMPLPDDTVVYPGHGEKSTIGFERLHNPYLLNTN
jgi:Zn-dependent hydrolases, including glyoxylases